MAVLSLNSNVASAQTQRRLAQTTAELNSVFTRLSSGLRINKASDDAAGLSIASSLNTDTRIYGQAVRNVNDAISLSRIAQGAMGELSNIVTRIAELAEQSANGTLSYTQRNSLDKEAQALKKEYNRIVDATEFNGVRLFDPANRQTNVMAGMDLINLSLSALDTSSAGDGTFLSVRTVSPGVGADSTLLMDFNGDGKIDLASGGAGSTSLYVAFGQGDGTFASAVTYVNGSETLELVAGDANGDGITDIFTSSNAGTGLNVFLGNANGTFKTATAYGAGLAASTQSIDAADLNGDGHTDIVLSENTGTARIMFANSDGSFRLGSTYSIASGAVDVQLEDVNGDGTRDLVSMGTSGISVSFGNGNGTFIAKTNYVDATGIASGVQRLALGDLNNDGAMDIITANTTGNSVDVFLNNGNGTFLAAKTTAGFTVPRGVNVSDINGDGNLDLIAGEGGTSIGFIMLGNGDGSFLARSTFATVNNARDIDAIDLNGDGSKDLVYGSAGAATGIGILMGNADKNEKLQYFSLRTQEDALDALNVARDAIQNVAASMGILGASESRLDTVLSTLYQYRENTAAAASRIQDADVAEEAGRLTRLSILQQAGQAILTQANTAPELALKLLKNS